MPKELFAISTKADGMSRYKSSNYFDKSRESNCIHVMNWEMFPFHNTAILPLQQDRARGYVTCYPL
jgi:hypothetical protein